MNEILHSNPESWQLGKIVSQGCGRHAAGSITAAVAADYAAWFKLRLKG